MNELNVNGRRITLEEGDITRHVADAIVNAANSTLLGGGGVDGAIHAAGGPSILEECRRIGGCPTGEARITTAGRLPARYVIHAVGPVWQGGNRGEPEKLASAYRWCLRLADEHALRSIAFPSISTGAYRYPIEQAARLALQTVRDHLQGQTSLERVTFVLFGRQAHDVYAEALAEIAAAVR